LTTMAESGARPRLPGRHSRPRFAALTTAAALLVVFAAAPAAAQTCKIVIRRVAPVPSYWQDIPRNISFINLVRARARACVRVCVCVCVCLCACM
jgi:hypothetical protein